MTTQQTLYAIPLHLITQFLDGYSLCQIAQVSKLFTFEADSCESWKAVFHLIICPSRRYAHISNNMCQPSQMQIILFTPH